MKTIKNMILAATLAATTAWSLPAAAADAVTFGIVDMNKVMQVTEAAKGVFSQLESKRKEYQSHIAKEEDALRSAEQEIMKQKDTVSKDEFEKKRSTFEAKVLAGQKLVQDRKRILDHAFNGSMGHLRNEAAKVVADVAKERGYAAVFTQDAVMISMPELDMTDVVIERMNKTVKKIPVDWEASAGKAEDAGRKAGKKK